MKMLMFVKLLQKLCRSDFSCRNVAIWAFDINRSLTNAQTWNVILMWTRLDVASSKLHLFTQKLISNTIFCHFNASRIRKKRKHVGNVWTSKNIWRTFANNSFPIQIVLNLINTAVREIFCGMSWHDFINYKLKVNYFFRLDDIQFRIKPPKMQPCDEKRWKNTKTPRPWWDSNPQSPAPEADALSIRPQGRAMRCSLSLLI